MMSKTKNIMYYFLQFCLTIIILVGVILTILRFTILDSNYILKTINDNNYYKEVYNSLNNEIDNYIIQSGFGNEILENIYNEENVKKNIDNMIISLYNGEAIKIDTTPVEQALNENIAKYLKTKGITVSDSILLKKFVHQIAEVYKNEIILSDTVTKLQSTIPKIITITNISIAVCIVLAVILVLLIKLVLKKKISIIPLLTVSLLLLISYLIIVNNIDIFHIYFLTNSFSVIIQDIIHSVLNIIRNLSISMLIISIIYFIILYLKTKNVTIQTSK